MAGVDDEENELGVLEFIHAFVEILDKHFGQVDNHMRSIWIVTSNRHIEHYFCWLHTRGHILQQDYT